MLNTKVIRYIKYMRLEHGSFSFSVDVRPKYARENISMPFY